MNSISNRSHRTSPATPPPVSQLDAVKAGSVPLFPEFPRGLQSSSLPLVPAGFYFRLLQEGSFPHLVGKLPAPTDTFERSLVADAINYASALVALEKPSMLFLGGARFNPGDPYYQYTQEVGRQLALHGLIPKTGAGPGVMEAVLKGFKEALDSPAVKKKFPGWAPMTQGSKIFIQSEQETTPFVDTNVVFNQLFHRKAALFINTLGTSVHAGGIGTGEECFHIQDMAARGAYPGPVVWSDGAFWNSILKTLYRASVQDRELISQRAWDTIVVKDTPRQVAKYLALHQSAYGFNGDPTRELKFIIQEALDSIRQMRQPPAEVSIIGGNLKVGDPNLALVSFLASKLTHQEIPLRMGGSAQVASAVIHGVGRSKRPHAPPRIICPRYDSKQFQGRARVYSPKYISAPDVLGINARALIALPGGFQTLATLFSFLCNYKLGKTAPIPLILVDKRFWEPVMKAFIETMIHHGTAMASEFSPIVYADTLEQALNGLNHIPEPPKRT